MHEFESFFKNNNLSNLLKNIKLLLLDVDGVLTDNQIYISSDETELKSFCIDDGTGAAIARFSKLNLGLLSGRHSKCTKLWADELGIKCCIQGVIDKKNKVRPLIKLGSNIKRRQDAPECYDINASIYIWKRKALSTK